MNTSNTAPPPLSTPTKEEQNLCDNDCNDVANICPNNSPPAEYMHDNRSDSRAVYESPSYVSSREQTLAVIPKTSWLNSVDRYAGSIAVGIFMAVGGAIISPASVPLYVIAAGFVLGLAATAWGIRSHYKSRRISAPIDIRRNEEMTIAAAKIQAKENAKELGAVLTEYFKGKHSKNSCGIAHNDMHDHHGNSNWKLRATNNGTNISSISRN